MQAVLFGVYYA